MCLTLSKAGRQVAKSRIIGWKSVLATNKRGVYKSGQAPEHRSPQRGHYDTVTTVLAYTLGKTTKAAAGSPGIYVFLTKPLQSYGKRIIEVSIPRGAWFHENVLGDKCVAERVRVRRVVRSRR